VREVVKLLCTENSSLLDFFPLSSLLIGGVEAVEKSSDSFVQEL